MTLEEAIKAEEAETLAYEECLNSLDDNMPTDMWNELNKSLGKQMDYHRQLAEWLKKLQAYEEAREEIIRKRDSGQWSEAVVFGFNHAIYIIDKHLNEVKADE